MPIDNEQVINTSGITGVCFHKAAQKWHARTRVNGKQINLGLFTTKEDAALALNSYAMGAKEQREKDIQICNDQHYNWRFDDEPNSDSGPHACANAIRISE